MQDLFWVHRTILEKEGLQVGFGTFSPAHFIWLALMIAGIAAFTACYRRCTERGRDNIRKASALFIILFEIFKQCTVALTGISNVETLPVELCSMAEYAMLADAMWPKNRFLRQPFLYLFLPAALLALLLPTVVVYPAISFYTLHQFVMHAVIAAYIIARCAAGEFRATYPGIWTSVGKFLPVVALIYWIDLHFDKSYMFLTDPYGNPVLEFVWRVTGNKGGLPYIGGLLLLFIILIHVLYLIYVLLRRGSFRSA